LYVKIPDMDLNDDTWLLISAAEKKAIIEVYPDLIAYESATEDIHDNLKRRKRIASNTLKLAWFKKKSIFTRHPSISAFWFRKVWRQTLSVLALNFLGFRYLLSGDLVKLLFGFTILFSPILVILKLRHGLINYVYLLIGLPSYLLIDSLSRLFKKESNKGLWEKVDRTK
jgi:hypothetical protein